MVTVRYINVQYEFGESYFGTRRLAKNFKKMNKDLWVEYIIFENNVVYDKSESTRYL